MNNQLIIYAFLSGITVFLGALLSHFFNHHMADRPIKYEITHTMMSFGAGILLSALTLVLVPKGMAELSWSPMVFTFLAGTIVFLIIDRVLARKGGQVANLLAMMMDFVPESIALGAVFLSDPKTSLLLALFIGLQNLPEAFNAYRDVVLGGFSVRKTLLIFFFLSFAGVVGAFLGQHFLSDSPTLTAYLMTFFGGGILYLLVQDIIPESKMEKNYLISAGACVGFLVGVVGDMVI